MNRARIVLLLVAAWTLLLISASMAVEVTAVGYGNDKDAAIEDAKRNAIARTLGEFVDSRSLVENFALVSDKILSSSSGYVTDFDVNNRETLSTGEVRVEITANVQRESLAEDVDRIRVLSARRGDPRFVVIPEPKLKNSDIDRDLIMAASQGIEDYLSGNGYSTLMSPRHKIDRSFSDPGVLADLSEMAAGVGAEYVIYFDLMAVDDGSGRVFQRSAAIVDASVVHTGSYRLITTVEGRGSGGDQHGEFAFRDACRTAGYNAAQNALRAVLDDWQRAGSVNGNQLTLEMEGLPADTVISFEAELSRAGYVKQATLSSKDGALSVFQVTLDGDTYDLGRAVEQVAADNGWQVWMTEASRSRLRYVLIYD